MSDRDLLSELGQTVAAYLNTIRVVSECLESACPEVGRPYHSRIMRLRSRAAFQATPQAIHESAEALRLELQSYSTASSRFLDSQNRELRHSVATLEQAAEKLALSVEHFSTDLRRLADQIESAAVGEDSGPLYARALRTSVDAMAADSVALMMEARRNLHESGLRLAEAQITDDATGVISRSEMLRQVQARRDGDIGFTPIVITLSDEADDAVMQQAAAKITNRFRHNDVLGRWGEREFLLLFHGEPGLAQYRMEQVLPFLNGVYATADGRAVDVEVSSTLLESEPVLA
ncbi:MAG: GGDEF domain-containing protein [Bryobacteraceae bacterium]